LIEDKKPGCRGEILCVLQAVYKVMVGSTLAVSRKGADNAGVAHWKAVSLHLTGHAAVRINPSITAHVRGKCIPSQLSFVLACLEKDFRGNHDMNKTNTRGGGL